MYTYILFWLSLVTSIYLVCWVKVLKLKIREQKDKNINLEARITYLQRITNDMVFLDAYENVQSALQEANFKIKSLQNTIESLSENRDITKIYDY